MVIFLVKLLGVFDVGLANGFHYDFSIFHVVRNILINFQLIELDEKINGAFSVQLRICS